MADKKNIWQDLFLGVFTAIGLEGVVRSPSRYYFAIAQNANFYIARTFAIIELILFVILTIIIWKTIKVSKEYTKYFLIAAAIIFIGNLLMLLSVISI